MSNPYIIPSQPNQQIISGQDQQAADYQSALSNFLNNNSPATANNSNPQLMQLAMALRGKDGKDNKNGAISNFWNQNVSPYMPWNQISEANKYGTDPYSQQTTMLAQQDQGF